MGHTRPPTISFPTPTGRVPDAILWFVNIISHAAAPQQHAAHPDNMVKFFSRPATYEVIYNTYISNSIGTYRYNITLSWQHASH